MPNSCLILSTPLIMNFGIKRERERVLIICCALIKTSAIPKKSRNENKKWHGQKSFRLGFKGKIKHSTSQFRLELDCTHDTLRAFCALLSFISDICCGFYASEMLWVFCNSVQVYTVKSCYRCYESARCMSVNEQNLYWCNARYAPSV